MHAVDEVLEEIGAGEKPRLLVLNKADRLSDDDRREVELAHPDAVLVSALEDVGLEELRERIEAAFAETLTEVELLIPYSQGGRLHELHEVAGDLERTDREDGVLVTARVPRPSCTASTTSLSSESRRGSAPCRRLSRLAHGLPRHPTERRRGGADAGPRGRRRARPLRRRGGPYGAGRALGGRHRDRGRDPRGHAGLVLPRSGLAREHGITLVNSPGLIDAGYRGEVRVLLLNTDPAETVKIEAGARIAQLVLTPIALAEPVETTDAHRVRPR